MTSTNKNKAGRVRYYKPGLRIIQVRDLKGMRTFYFHWRVPNPKYADREKNSRVEATLKKFVRLPFVSEVSAREWMALKLRELRRLYGDLMKPEKTDGQS